MNAPAIAFALFLVLYACFALSLSHAPLQDLPNHLARAHVIADILFNQGAIFDSAFKLQLSVNPYLSGDLILAVFDRYLGTEWTARLWIVSSVLLLPVSVRFALLSQGVTRNAAYVGAILAFYLATGWFFVMGFINFQLAFACAGFAYGWFLRAARTGTRRSYAAYVVTVALAYSMHLSALIFVCAFVGTTLAIRVLWRELSFSRALVLGLPPYVIFALHLAVANHSAPGTWPTSWGTWQTKLMYVGSPIVRFDLGWESALLGLFLASCVFPLAFRAVRDALRPVVIQLLLVPVFLGLYLALPSYTGNIYSVDVRAVPYALMFLVFAGVASTRVSRRLARMQFILACVVACANIGYLAAEVLPENERMAHYEEIAASAVPGAHILPVNTRSAIGRYRPFMHAGSFATVDSNAIIPYLFAADLNPPMTYFSYVARDYAPSEFWYAPGVFGRQGGAVDEVPSWDRIRQQYQYILITAPWDPRRIAVPYTVVRSNEAASLLKIENQSLPSRP